MRKCITGQLCTISAKQHSRAGQASPWTKTWSFILTNVQWNSCCRRVASEKRPLEQLFFLNAGLGSWVTGHMADWPVDQWNGWGHGDAWCTVLLAGHIVRQKPLRGMIILRRSLRQIIPILTPFQQNLQHITKHFCWPVDRQRHTPSMSMVILCWNVSLLQNCWRTQTSALSQCKGSAHVQGLT